ncbi:DNA phosphorothioation system sulfurtransferase DndC [Nitrospiraceae bacterium HYJII51-Mn-bac16s-1-B09]|uniref:DNA phosphorothioation system sulfurtransferase DndC n=2 Tax=Candidatus Manganitrophus noduliformans TaxID=2606439 RepID=A0A7X6DMU1_9BACT|nr:DNA phosphorothioation system sulfurtransferase DndC [Candidatus Manganitrophus noduliformans]
MLEKERLDARYDEIRSVYLEHPQPWVIGYSGGKDSTTALQLIWSALSKLPKEKLSKPLYIISSDTLVETPKIVDYIDSSLEKMNVAAREQGLPFTAHKVKPLLKDTFWVNLIGRGYPAPSKRFRWCTERLKIDPANHFILDKVAEHGEVIVVLGVRKSESATRAQVMSLHRVKGSLLSRHTTLPNASVYTPIEDFTVEDVWTYLLQVPSPWGSNNRDLVTLYRNAQAGECPLVVDKTTPSCGNSRFGCWVCTVVTRDKSMEAMIENGEEWLEPMLEYRDLLASTQDPAVKAQVRELKRRNGRVMAKAGGGIIFGPYKLEVRKDLLRRLLQVQKQVRTTGPNPNEGLIGAEELFEIRRLWRSEAQDWEDSVPKIYREVMGEDLDWIADDQPTFSSEERRMLDSICERHDVPSTMVAKLLDIERELHGMSRRSSIHQKIASVLEEDWRSEEEIISGESES